MARGSGTPARVAYLMVVRRGDHDRYHFLASTFRDRPVEVVWDRRVSERRRAPDAIDQAAERRCSERRRQPPDSWSTLGFLVARMDLDEQTVYPTSNFPAVDDKPLV